LGHIPRLHSKCEQDVPAGQMLGKVSQCLQCTQHVPTEIQVPSPPVPLSEFTTAPVDPVPTYVADRREDPLAGPSREDLAVDGSEDEMWANLGVNRRDTPAE
jgi:hypothetical protein